MAARRQVLQEEIKKVVEITGVDESTPLVVAKRNKLDEIRRERLSHVQLRDLEGRAKKVAGKITAEEDKLQKLEEDGRCIGSSSFCMSHRSALNEVSTVAHNGPHQLSEMFLTSFKLAI